jgi:uncharacterized membrane protein
MGLYFHSDYPKATLYLAVMLPDSSCKSGGEFRKQGWWKIVYGDTVEVLSGDLTKVIAGGYCYYYAHAEDGTVWAGPYDTLVSDAKFNQCYGDETGMTKNIGYRELYLPFVSAFTLHLTP